jgi:hypothetical protein
MAAATTSVRLRVCSAVGTAREPKSIMPCRDRAVAAQDHGRGELDPRRQDALVNHKWPGDIARQRQQLEILQRLRQGG